MQRNDVGMSQLANYAGFAKEAISRFPNREFGAKQLYRQLPPDHRVKSAHHAAGGAHAQSFKELVASDLQGGPSVTWVQFTAGRRNRK